MEYREWPMSQQKKWCPYTTIATPRKLFGVFIFKVEPNVFFHVIGVMNANAMEFIHLNVHPRLVINLYFNFSLVSIQF
jgi:hypothetical protein